MEIDGRDSVKRKEIVVTVIHYIVNMKLKGLQLILIFCISS